MCTPSGQLSPLFHPRGYDNHLYATESKILVFNSGTTPVLILYQKYTTNSLPDTSTWISKQHYKLKLPETKLFIHISIQICSTLCLLQLYKYTTLHLVSPSISLSYLKFSFSLTPHIQPISMPLAITPKGVPDQSTYHYHHCFHQLSFRFLLVRLFAFTLALSNPFSNTQNDLWKHVSGHDTTPLQTVQRLPSVFRTNPLPNCGL